MAKRTEPGSNIIAYDSFEEMQADQQRAHDAAMENMTESQQVIPLGGYAINLSHLDNPEIGPIYGAIQSVAELVAWHELYAGVGDLDAARAVLAERGVFDPPRTIGSGDPATWEEEGHLTAQSWLDYYVTQHVESWVNGYLFGTWFSAIEEGELGSAHKSVCVETTAEVYQDAQEHGGKISVEHAGEVSAAIRAIRAEHQARKGATEGEGDDDTDSDR